MSKEYRSLLEKEINTEGKIVIKAEGCSMKPFIRPTTDILIIEKLKAPVKRDDIVLFYYQGKVVLHRVIAIRDCEKIDTRGDNNFKPEKGVQTADVFGKLEAVQRNKRIININSKGHVLAARIWSSLIPLRSVVGYFRRRAL